MIPAFDRAVIDDPVIRRFEVVASRCGSAPAVHDSDGVVSYRELSQRVAQYAADLDASVPARAPVAIDLPTSRDYLAAMLAALATNRAYIPIDRSYPAERNAAILAQAAASHVFRADSDGSVRLVRRPSTADVVDLPETPPGNGAAAYIVYTSGSTGEPKGVWQNQRGLLHDVWQYVDFVGIDHSDTLSMLYSPSVIGSVRDIFGALLTGGQVVMMDLRRDGLRRTLDRLHPVTIVHGMPPVLRTLARETGPFCPSARLIYTAGDRFDGNDLALLRSVTGPGCDIYTGIGSSECSTLYRHWIIPRDWHPENGLVPVGYPIADRHVDLLDDRGESVPAGEIGRIVVTSQFLARGYWRSQSPRLTSVPSRPQFMRFDTGDYGRLRPDGLLEFHGRADRQIKVSGHRFEPGALESALRAEREVSDARVVVIEGASPTVVAVVESGCTAEASAEEIAAGLSRRLRSGLPAAFIPHRIVVTPALPRLPNFKIDDPEVAVLADRAARTMSVVDDLDSAPRDPSETLVAEIFSQVLRQPIPGRDADFFALGGDSLAGHRVISRLETALGRELSPATLFANPTVRGLARRLTPNEQVADASAGGGPAATAPAVSAESADGVPASFAQKRMWFLHQFHPGLTAYHITTVWRLVGDLDVAALRRALVAVVERHPALRTAFRMRGGELIQIVCPPELVALDEDAVHGTANDLILTDWRRREGERPFDLSSGPMMRVRLLRITPGEHLLALTVHHIASDGWSMSVFIRDLTEFYNADRENRAPRLPTLGVRYQDYATWQRRRLTGPRAARLEDYWVNRLRDLPALELPTDTPRPPAPSYRGAGVQVQIDPHLANSFARLCRDEGATLQMGLVAAVAVVVHRHSRQQDFAIGVPHWGRGHPDLEDVVGLFVNTLPIRLAVDPRQSFRRLLQQVRSTAIDAYSNSELPFDRIVDALGVPRDTSRNPLVQVLVQVVDGPAPTLGGLIGLRAEREPGRDDSARTDVEFILQRCDDGSLTGTAIFATDLFSAERIERLVSHVHTVLTAAVSEPDDPVGSLDLAGEAERSLIERWRRGQTVERPHCGVHHLFDEQVRRTPDAVALVADGEQLTYADLDADAERLAGRLIAAGVGPDVVVAVCLSRSVAWVVGVLAVFKSGGAYLPMDPALPPARCQTMANLAAPALILTDSPRAGRFQAAGIAVITVDGRSDGLPARCADPGPCRPAPTALAEAGPDSLAYVLFTSGSTGVPKAVAVDHRLLTNLIVWHTNHPRLGLPSRTVQFASCGFDVSLQEIFGTFATGGALVLMDRDTQRDSRLLLRHLVEHRVERLFLPYVALEQLAVAAMESGYPADLRDIVCAGEQLTLTPPIRRLLEELPDCRLHNHYGPTESHIMTTLVLPPEVDRWPTEASIGRPIDNAEVRVLDSAGLPCPVGVPGELHIGGVSVARGYLNNPQETAAKFVDGPTGRVYRTGDLASWEPDGTLRFHGRIDDQVKIRGFRIEPGEVAAVLLEHPGVVQSAVVAARDEAGRARLVAYWVSHTPTRTGGGVDGGELRSFLSARLPDYMVPAAFVELDALPLTDNAKLDRRALPTPFRDADGTHRAGPSTDLERQLLAVWAHVLGHEDIGVADNFFLAGGDSVSAVRLAGEIEMLGGQPISVAEIFRRPTIEEQARWLAGRAPDAPRESNLIALQPAGQLPPLYVVHGWGGGVGAYIPLSRALAPQRPVYGVRASDADLAVPFPSVSDIAARYADQILARQPRGTPIHLLGYSAGGWYAHAVAAALVERGATIGMLGVCDSGIRVRAHRRIGMLTLPLKFLERVPVHLSSILSPLNGRTRRDQLWQLTRSAAAHARVHLVHRRDIEDRLRHAAMADADDGSEDPDRDFHMVALQGHRPQRLRIAVDVFAPRRHLRRMRVLWGFYARGGIRTHPIFAEHRDFSEPGLAPALATELDTALRVIDSVTAPAQGNPRHGVKGARW